MLGNIDQKNDHKDESRKILRDFADIFSRMASGDYSAGTKLIGRELPPEIVEEISRSLNSIELRELERKCMEEEIFRRDKILEAIGSACRICMDVEFLKESIEALLGAVGRAIGLQRIYLLENPPINLPNDDQKKRLYEWLAEDYDPQTAQSRLLSFGWRDIDRNQWEAFLSRSENSQDENYPEMYGSRDLWSVLVFPVFTRKKYWGLMGLETGHSITAWGQGEIEALEIVSHLLGQLIEKDLDLTEKKLLEKKLEETRHLESLGILAGGVAHDLNNILGPMAGYPDLLSEYFEPDSSARKDLSIIKDSAIKASDIIQDLLTLSGNNRYEMTFLNLNELVIEYLDSVTLKFKLESAEAIQIERNLGSELPSLYGSRPHIWKIIMNLVNNAINSLPNGGHIKISTYMEKNEDDQDYIVFLVSNRGKDPETRDILRIFEPIFSSQGAVAGGKGLGLAVAYRIVRDHEGLFQVENFPGEGSDISVHFPPHFSPREQLPINHKNTKGSELILIVDDSPAQLKVASKILGSLGYAVETVNSPHEALDMVRKKEYDLIISDMLLENSLDGLDLFNQIRQIRPAQKAIIVSGYSENQRVIDAEECGVQMFVRKPYTREILGRAVRAVLDKQP